MANEFRKVTDQNGVNHPVCDDTRVDWSSYAVLGAKNWFNYTKVTTENNGVTFTNSNNQSCTLSGQATADQAAIEMGSLTVDKDTEFIFNGASSSNNAKIHMYVFDSTTNARPYTNSSKTTLQNNNCFGTGANKEIPFFAEAGHVIKVYARVQTTGTSVPSDTVFWPMVRLATDPDPTFAPNALTNRELTNLTKVLPVSVYSGTTMKDIYNSLKAIDADGFKVFAFANTTGLPTLTTGFGIMIWHHSFSNSYCQVIAAYQGNVESAYISGT